MGSIDGISIVKNVDAEKAFKVFVGYDSREEVAYQLANYDGWAVFVDCDFLYLGDIKDLSDMANVKYALMCVHRDYNPKQTMKMDGKTQTVYPRKNWSSMVLHNCGHPQDVMSMQTGAYLHRFQWLDDEDIGSVPFVWNFLVGHNEIVEGDPSTHTKAIYYTLGGPWFDEWKDCQFGDLWTTELEEYKREHERNKVQ